MSNAEGRPLRVVGETKDEQPDRLDALVIDAFRAEGLDVKVADTNYEVEAGDWLVQLGRIVAAGIEGWMLALWHPALGGSDRIVTIEEQDRPLDYVAATWGPLLRTLAGCQPMILSQGVGDVYRVAVSHPDWLLEDQRWIVRATNQANAEALASEAFHAAHDVADDYKATTAAQLLWGWR